MTWKRCVIFLQNESTIEGSSVIRGTRGGAGIWGTVLQAGRSRVRFPMVSLEFFNDIILTQPITEMGTRNNSWGVKAVGTDNIITFMCRMSWNLGASTSWKPQGLSRPLMRLFYLYIYLYLYLLVQWFVIIHMAGLSLKLFTCCPLVLLYQVHGKALTKSSYCSVGQ
jgi:hypothetical protein